MQEIQKNQNVLSGNAGLLKRKPIRLLRPWGNLGLNFGGGDRVKLHKFKCVVRSSI